MRDRIAQSRRLRKVLLDIRDGRGGIEKPMQARRRVSQVANVFELKDRRQVRFSGGRAHLHGAARQIAAVALEVNFLDARNSAGCQKRDQRRPIVRRPERQGERNAAARRLRSPAPQVARRASVSRFHSVIEAADAGKPGGKGNIGNRQGGLAEQFLGEQEAARDGHGHRRGAQMLVEQPAQVAASYT